MAHAAVVLAAGGSRRLGRSKQLLVREGETLVHRATRLAAQTAPRRLLVMLGAERDAVRATLSDLDCECVVNAGWESGLAGSLRLAATALSDHDGPVLVLGCDQPALEAAHLRELSRLSQTSASGCAATSHDGRPGIPAVLSAALWAQAAALREDRGFGGLLAAQGDAVAMLEAPELAFDIDDEAGLLAAVRDGWIDPDR